ncbi:hypothetical protein MN608_05960 [Microdochium nivale]|nr:hypothetical protein MN608_05960 [Microdochium nivale]
MTKDTTAPAIPMARRQQPPRRPQNLDLSGHVDLNKPLPQICRALSGLRSDDDDDDDDEGPTPTSGESMEVRFCLEGSPVSKYHHHRPAPPVPKAAPYKTRGGGRHQHNKPGVRPVSNGEAPAKKSCNATTPKPCPMPGCKGFRGKSGLCRNCEIQPRLSTFAGSELSGAAAWTRSSETSQVLYDVLFEQLTDPSADSGILDRFNRASIHHRKQNQKIEGYAGRHHGRRSHGDSRTRSGSGSARPSNLASRYANYSTSSRETEPPIAPLRLRQQQPHTDLATPASHSNARSHGRRLSHSSQLSPLATYSPVSPLSATQITNRAPEGFHARGLLSEGELEILSSQKSTVPGSICHRRPSGTAQQTPRSNNDRGGSQTSRDHGQFESFLECGSPEPWRAGYELFTTAAMKEQICMRAAATCDHRDDSYNEDGEGGVLEGVARLGEVVAGHARKVDHQRALPGGHGQQQEQLSVALPRTPEVYNVFSGDEYPGHCPGPYWF